MGLAWLFTQKEKVGLVLDIGSEAVKAALFEKKEEKIHILGTSLRYFDDFNFGEVWEFDRQLFKKTLYLTIADLSSKLTKKPQNVIIGLPRNLLKARVVSQILPRDTSLKMIDEVEAKALYQRAENSAKKNIKELYSSKSGILPQDLLFTNLKILEMKIDGYKVKGLKGYEGRKLHFRILGVFLQEHFLKEIASIVPWNVKIVHGAEGLVAYFSHIQEGIFIDAGGKTTGVFLVKAGQLEGVGEFAGGGKFFSCSISEKLGLREKDARILKEQYGQNKLTLESSQRIKEILHPALNSWFDNLKHQLMEMTQNSLLPSEIYFLGGASLLPGLPNILKEGYWGELAFTAKPKVIIFKNPQHIPTLLLIAAQT